MITYEDCLAFADLTPEQVECVAAREGLTAIAALGLASRLAATAGDEQAGRRIGDAAGPGAARPATIPTRMAPAQLRTGRLAA